MSCRTSNIDDEFIRSAGGGATSQNKTPHIVHGHQEQISHTCKLHTIIAVPWTRQQSRDRESLSVTFQPLPFFELVSYRQSLVHFTGGGRNNNRCSSPSHNIYNNTSNQHRSEEKIYSSPLPPHPSKNIKTIQEILLLQQPTKYMCSCRQKTSRRQADEQQAGSTRKYNRATISRNQK